MTPWDFEAWSARRRRARRIGYVVLVLILGLVIGSIVMVGHTLASIWFADQAAPAPEAGQ